MIAQVEKMLFVTPDISCEACDGTGAVWVDRDVNAAEECACIIAQIDEHEPAFSHYEIIGAKHELYKAMVELEKFHSVVERREHNRAVSFLYKTTA